MATVLIVEDEDSLRETLSRYLVHEGHVVIAAASGYEAFEVGFDARPDVLIADWMLKNHIHGLHVSEAFRALHPGLSTILITGFPSRDLLEESDRCGVTRLLEKPFELQDLQDAVDGALSHEALGEGDGPSVAAIAVGADGDLQFSSTGASELIEGAGLSPELGRLDRLIEGDALAQLGDAEQDWVEVTPCGGAAGSWVMRARMRPGQVGWLAVLCPRDDSRRRNDPRVRILLDVRSTVATRRLDAEGPVVVVERDGVVRRLLVSQIERVGALCYPSDDLASALRLLEAEPKVRTVLVDFALAGSDMATWVERIRSVRADANIIGTGGVGCRVGAARAGRVVGAPQALAHQRPARRARGRPLIRRAAAQRRTSPPRMKDSARYQAG